MILWVSVYLKKNRIYTALAMKNIKVNFIFLARLFVYLKKLEYTLHSR